MFNLEDYRCFHLTQKITQAAAADAVIGINVDPATGGMFIHSIKFGPDDYAAGRDIDVWLLQGAVKLHLLMNDSVDNTPVYGPTIATNLSTDVANTPNAIGIPYMPYYIPKERTFRVQGNSLVDGETLTAQIIVFAKFIPVTSTTGTDVAHTTDTIGEV
jgi:hypothetical protein